MVALAIVTGRVVFLVAPALGLLVYFDQRSALEPTKHMGSYAGMIGKKGEWIGLAVKRPRVVRRHDEQAQVSYFDLAGRFSSPAEQSEIPVGEGGERLHDWISSAGRLAQPTASRAAGERKRTDSRGSRETSVRQ